MTTKVTTICDLNTKERLNTKELKIVLGYGSDETFRKWRQGIVNNSKKRVDPMKFYKMNNTYTYKIAEVEAFIEANFKGIVIEL